MDRTELRRNGELGDGRRDVAGVYRHMAKAEDVRGDRRAETHAGCPTLMHGPVWLGNISSHHISTLQHWFVDPLSKCFLRP